MKKKEKALLIISFGSSHENARNSILNIEGYLQAKYPDHDFFRAFTSRMIVKKLQKRDNISIDLTKEALEKLYKAGYKEVVCQSLHILNGYEYEKTQKEILAYKNKFDKISFGRPLLTSTVDYEYIADIFKPIAMEHEAVLFMGHGAKHFSNAAYCMMEDIFRYKEIHNIYVATVEGFPKIDYTVKKMKQAGIIRITLMPFMIVAGEHAINDMSGSDEDSWKNILIGEGFDVSVIMKGLGDYKEIAELYYRHSTINEID